MRNKILHNSSSYNLLPLLSRSFTGYMKSLFVRYKPLDFPPVIGNYRFHSRMEKIGPRKSYPLAIYKNKKGKKAIAKMKDSRIKGYHYYSLLNEITMYEILNSTIKRIGNKIPKEFSNIYIPRFLYKYEDETKVVLLVEFVEGNIAENISPSKKILIYFKVVDFLQFIGKHLTKSEKRRISKRTPMKYLFLYPLIIVKAIITYPKFAPLVIRGIPIFLRSFPAILNDNKTSLVHRDLHFSNIILSQKKVTIVDFQHCVYTEPLQELVTTLRYWWKGWRDERFGNLLFNEIIKRYSKRKNFRKLFQAFAINSATHGLTGVGFSKKIIRGLKNTLNNMEKTTIAIGIPAYNEEANIKLLVDKLFKQTFTGVLLKKIVVISDGSTDDTVKEIRKIQDFRISIIDGHKRLGKSARLNQLFSTINSDILIVLDGDVLPSDEGFIQQIINPILKDKTVGLVSADTVCVKTSTLIEKLISDSHELKQFMYKRINHGHNIYLCHGRARAFTKNLYSQLVLPNNCPEDAYSYLFCLQRGIKFVFTSRAKVIFRSPINIFDHAKQSNRFVYQKEWLVKYFPPEFVKQQYRIPKIIMLKTLLRFISRRPLSTLGYLLINSYIRLSLTNRSTSLTKWETSTSSKRIVYD